jgi:recombination protein RecA
VNKAAQDVLDKVVAAVRAKLGREDAAVRLSASGARSNVTEVIPTGISVIDHWLCGVGGLPIGRTSEWSGAEGIGKTAWALHCMAATQRAGGVTIYGDAEGSFSEERAFSFGVDPDKVVLVQGDTLEEYVPGMLSAMSALDAAQPALVVYDSIGGSTTEAEIDGDRSADAMG